MRNNIILIDFENVQPASLEPFAAEHFRIVVFVGAKQLRLSFEIVESIHKLGSQAEYVKISGNGPNALDFHIAYCIGAMSATDPTACFHIVSKDAGFDPLIEYLKTKAIDAVRVEDVRQIPLTAVRVEDISQIPLTAVRVEHVRQIHLTAVRPKDVEKCPPVNAATVKPPQERVQFALDHLSKCKCNKPRTVRSLTSSIDSFFQKKLSAKEVTAIVEALKKRGIISVAGTQVTFSAAIHA